MDIAAMSTMLSQAKLQQQVHVSVLKLAMGTTKNQMNEMVQMVQQNRRVLERLAAPHLGGNIDINV